MLVVAFVLLLSLGAGVATATVFVIAFGMANGLMTIARGAVPLALFGAAGYGHMMGRIGGPYLLIQAIAPLVLAFVAERGSDPAVLTVTAAFAFAALAAFAAIRRPQPAASPI
jgi:hypothetical protein